MTTELIAKTFQGLEPLLAQELTELGATDIQIGRRMVSFTGDKEMMYRANFCLRTAIRVLKPIKQFNAKSADDVYEAVKAIDWSQYLSPETTFAVDSVVFSPEFHHSKFVAYKVKDAIADQFRERTGTRPNVSVTNPDIQLHIHISDYDATLALDSSGESLHRRGYRQETVAAPLNEVLAAGIILMTGWRGETDFLDPFCGSGTLCIEAALIARGIAPGVFRKGYAFEKWPDFDRELFEQIYNDDSSERDFNHHIYGRDIDPIAVGIARRNVRAAGLTKDITIVEADFTKCKLVPVVMSSTNDTTEAESAQLSSIRSDLTPLPLVEGQGGGSASEGGTTSSTLIVTNPPYGQRISSPDLLGLYKSIGQKLKREFSGGEAWILSFHEECFEEIGLKPSLKTPLYNGSLECELRKYVLFDGRLGAHRAAGGFIKTDEERRMMAEKHRFKQKREGFRRTFDDDAEGGERPRFGRRDWEDDRRRDFRGKGDRRDFREDGTRHNFHDGGPRHKFRDDREEGDDRHRFNKYSKNDNYKGHKGGFGKRDGGYDRSKHGFNRRDDYRAQGDDRAARQEARRRFFNSDNHEED